MYDMHAKRKLGQPCIHVLVPRMQFEEAWSKGEIPSNTEDILRSRGVFDGPGSPRLGNQDSSSQAYIEGKNMAG